MPTSVTTTRISHSHEWPAATNPRLGVTNIDDLLHWDAAWLDDRLLSERWRLLATTPHVATDQPGTRYGLGWRITGDSIWHSGESIGFRNVVVRFPASRLNVIMLTNRDAPEPHETALTIADLFLGQ